MTIASMLSVAGCALSILLATDLQAQWPLQWRELPTWVERAGAEACHDPVRGRTVLFGNNPVDTTGAVWEWDGAAYTGAYDFPSGSNTYRTWVGTWAFQPTGPYYVPTLVDVTPHLLPDIHPWWHVSSTPVPSNPIWQPCDTRYNPFLYATPGADVANPHGTYPDPLFPSFEWIDESPTFRVFGVFGPYGGGPPIIDRFTSWCVGTLGTSMIFWDTLPPTGGVTPNGGVALRFSVENDLSFFGAGVQKNIQTFQVIVQEGPQ